MDDHAPPACRGVARHLIRTLAALCLAVPVLAGPGEAPQEKDQAAKVAKKVEKALGKAHQAEEEREALRHFQDEVAEYAELHAKQLAKLGSRLPADAQGTVAAQKALAHAIAAERAKARPGDVFRPEVQPLSGGSLRSSSRARTGSTRGRRSSRMMRRTKTPSRSSCASTPSTRPAHHDPRCRRACC